MRDDYRANYARIAADHLAHWRATGANPWQSGEHVSEVGNATRDVLRRLVPIGGTILDAGCGMGELTEPMSSWRRYGIDFTPEYVEIARKKGIDAVVGDLEAMPYGNDQYDGVACVDVLEHVLDLNAVVRELLRVLKPGGVLVVRVPEREALAQYLSDANPYRFVHLRRFDRASLELLFTRIFDCDVIETTVVRKERIYAVRKR